MTDYIDAIPCMDISSADRAVEARAPSLYGGIGSSLGLRSGGGLQPGLDVGELDRAVSLLFSSGIAASTAKTYQCGQSRFLHFCRLFCISPSVVSEDSLPFCSISCRGTSSLRYHKMLPLCCAAFSHRSGSRRHFQATVATSGLRSSRSKT